MHIKKYQIEKKSLKIINTTILIINNKIILTLKFIIKEKKINE